MLNLSYLACYYYNLKKPNMYDLNQYTDREKARKNFHNATYIDIEMLEDATRLYKEQLEKEIAELNEFVRENKIKKNASE